MIGVRYLKAPHKESKRVPSTVVIATIRSESRLIMEIKTNA